MNQDQSDDPMFDLLLREAVGGPRPPDLSEQILQALRTGQTSDVPASDVPAKVSSPVAPPVIAPVADQRRKRRSNLRTHVLWLAALAAAVLVAIGVSTRRPPQPVAEVPASEAEVAEGSGPAGEPRRSDLLERTRPSSETALMPGGSAEQSVAASTSAAGAADAAGASDAAGEGSDFRIVSESIPFHVDMADDGSSNGKAGAAAFAGVDPATAFPPPVDRLADEVIVARIDSLLRSAWQSNGIEPAGEADEAIWRERMVNLLGVRDWEPSDGGPSSAGIRRVLSDTSARQSIARRFASTLLGPIGSARMSEPQLEAFTRWLAPVIEGRLGFDRLAAQLITARGSADPQASDFNPATLWLTSLAGPRSIPLVEQFGHAMLDVDLRCGRCHDHPLDGRVWQNQYWELNAVFQTSLRWSRGENGALRVDRETAVRSGDEAVVFFELPDGRQRVAAPGAAWQWIVPSVEAGEAELIARQASSLEGLAATLRQNPKLAEAAINRIWETVYGSPLVGSAADPTAPPESKALRQLHRELAEQLRAHDFNVGRALSWVAAAAPMRLESPAVLEPRNYELASDAELEAAGEQLRQFAAYPPALPREDFGGLAAMVQRWGGGPASLANGPDALLGQFGDPSAQAVRTSPRAATGRGGEPAGERTLRAIYDATAATQPMDWLERVGSDDAFEQRALHLFYLAGHWNPSSRQLAAAESLRTGASDEAVALRRLWWVLSQERS